MSKVFNMVGGGGKNISSIVITGLKSTDTVTCTKDGKTYPATWDETDQKWEIVGLPLGTFTITATKSGSISTETVLIDIAGVYEIEFSLIPSEYAQLEYIQSTGTQYINTEYYTTEKFGIKAVVQWTDIPSSGGFIYNAIGSSRNGPYNSIALDNNRGDNVKYIAFGCKTGGGWYKPDDETEKQDIRANYNGDGQLVFNNSIKLTSGFLFNTADYPLYIFATSYNNSVERFAKMKLYELEFTEDNATVRHYIPCKRKSDSGVGLYDIITDTFFVNSGSGTFGAGNPV